MGSSTLLPFMGLLLYTASLVSTYSYYCDSGWELFRDHCYYVSSDRKNWRESLQICQTFGANLASIHDKEENTFAVNLAQNDERNIEIWIGARTTQDMINFEWIDGSAWDFQGTIYGGQWAFEGVLALDVTRDYQSPGKVVWNKWTLYLDPRSISFMCKKLAKVKHGRPPMVHA
ncbi:hypothetical protein L596_012795 [Steinernema carpocapsae]|uniref:C-type lectin domain-containing protein n=1 Tax=Steinernema carpocapsae TaxID=34508 RepID=A0A4V6A4Y3_STECR|nr:hypothetical protein L596_012795 [Steinernema carpocapsae]